MMRWNLLRSQIPEAFQHYKKRCRLAVDKLGAMRLRTKESRGYEKRTAFLFYYATYRIFERFSRQLVCQLFLCMGNDQSIQSGYPGLAWRSPTLLGLVFPTVSKERC